MTEHAEPQKGASHMPAVLTALIAIVFLTAVPFLVLRAGDRRAEPAVMDADTRERTEGEKVYQRNCVGCHEPRGQGRPGQYPSLIGAPWLLGDKETAIRIVLLGVVGPMECEGRTYNNAMPNFGVNLSDLDIARVLTFTRGHWGNQADAVNEAEVAKVRASLGARTQPWGGGGELDAARKSAVLP
jgi:mono/diheme cytochrome c family protein